MIPEAIVMFPVHVVVFVPRVRVPVPLQVKLDNETSPEPAVVKSFDVVIDPAIAVKFPLINVKLWHEKLSAIPFEKALCITADCCSTNIVRMIKKNNGDDLNTGEIKNGRFADLVIGEIKGRDGNYTLKIDSVFVRGEKVK